MSKIFVDENRCPQNHPCPAVRLCPAAAMKQNKFKAPMIDPSTCLECKKCVRVCPMGAIQSGI